MIGFISLFIGSQAVRQSGRQAVRQSGSQSLGGLLNQVRQSGYDAVVILGDGDIADICRLTCLEQGIAVADMIDGTPANLPVLEVHGVKVHLNHQEKLHEA